MFQIKIKIIEELKNIHGDTGYQTMTSLTQWPQGHNIPVYWQASVMAGHKGIMIFCVPAMTRNMAAWFVKPKSLEKHLLQEVWLASW